MVINRAVSTTNFNQLEAFLSMPDRHLKTVDTRCHVSAHLDTLAFWMALDVKKKATASSGERVR